MSGFGALAGYGRHVEALNRWSPADFLPFVIAGVTVGQIDLRLLPLLDARPELAITQDAVILTAGDDFASRSAALAAVTASLDGALAGVRHRREPYAVTPDWGCPALAVLDRGFAQVFGIRAYGIHMNGYVRHPDGGMSMWIGRRAADKAIAPDKLDHLVAGGQPHGLGLLDNLIKEAAEEADIPESLARQAVPVGTISYRYAQPIGFRDDLLFVYDLEVPAGFTPHNRDGEHQSFELLPIADVARLVRETDAFKFNVTLVITDFLIRHGLIAPDQPGYARLVAGLRQ